MGDTNTQAPEARIPSAPRFDQLFEVASEQAGHFTAQQARYCGFGWALLSHHARSGRFVRVHRGLYRLRDYPASPREHVMAAWLILGKGAAVSHESALEILGVSDVIPDMTHLTVPRSRRNLPSLSGVRIHTTSRPFHPEDLWERDGMTLTSATRTILDTAETGADPDQIETAVAQAIERGLAIPRQLRHGAASRSRRVAALITGALRDVEV